MSSRNTNSSIDIKDVLAIVLKRKWLIVIPLLLVTVAAYAGSYLLTPIYESSTIIWIDRPANVSRELIDIIGRERTQRQSGDERRRELQALQNEITSQTYLSQLVRDLNLDDNPALTEAATELLKTNPEQNLEQLKMHLLVKGLRKKITVGFVGADQIKIAVQGPDPVMARDMVTRLTEILENEKSAYEMERILDNQTFADLQLQRTERLYQQALDSLAAAQTRLTRLELPTSISSPENRLEVLSDIDNTQLLKSEYERELEDIRRSLRSIGFNRPSLRFSGEMNESRTQIDQQIVDYAIMVDNYTWADQSVVNANIRIGDNMRLLERAIEDAVETQFVGSNSVQREQLQRYFVVTENISLLDAKVVGLQGALGRIEDRLAGLPKLQADIAEQERLVSEARRYRDAFRSEESTVEILSDRVKDRTKYRIIEPARVPLAPVWPNKAKIVVMGLLLGLVIGGGAVFLSEIVDKSFRNVDDVEELLQLPVLATIPKIENPRFTR
jgi:uncharacterized protein involved in exopolysaccharide biosynthesis